VSFSAVLQVVIGLSFLFAFLSLVPSGCRRTDALQNVQSGLETIDARSLPIGWATPTRPSNWYGAVAGWFLTALAISLGAPFWFDLLGRVARLRSTGVRPPTSLPPSAEAEPPAGAVLETSR
jgi:hypothetical protein